VLENFDVLDSGSHFVSLRTISLRRVIPLQSPLPPDFTLSDQMVDQCNGGTFRDSRSALS
jgi:hypothetical protein